MDMKETLKVLRQNTHYTRPVPFIDAIATRGKENDEEYAEAKLQTDTWSQFEKWIEHVAKEYDLIIVESSQEDHARNDVISTPITVMVRIEKTAKGLLEGSLENDGTS